MTHHTGDPGFPGLVTLNAALHNEGKDEETLKALEVKLSHAPTVVEDESFYVSSLPWFGISCADHEGLG
jgi:hypothetical protein